MTIQYNFFAMGEDEDLITGEVLSLLHELYSLPDRAPLDEMIPKKIQEPKSLLSGSFQGKCYLFHEKEIENAIIRKVPKDLYAVQFREFACLEYRPSRLAEGDVLHIGRFAYFYTEDEDFMRLIQKLLRRLRRHAKKVPNSGSYWIFPEAARCAPTLEGW